MSGEPPAGSVQLDRRGSLRARAARGVLWTAAGNWGEQLTALLVFATLARLLEPSAFGLVALASVFVGLTQVIAGQGLSDAVVQRKDLEPQHLDSAFWLSVVFGVALGGLLAALALPLAHLFGQPTLAPVIACLAASIPITSCAVVQKGILARELAFRSLALRNLVATAAGGAAGIVAALLGLGVWSLVIQSIVLQSVGVAVLWRVTPWRPRFSFSVAHARDLLGFGVHVVGFRVLSFVTRRLDDLVIGAFLGPVALGLYSIGYRMLRLLMQLTISLIDQVAFPVYSKVQLNPSRIRNAFYRSSGFAALITFPMFLGIAVLAPQLIAVVFGERWAASIPVMQVLTLLGIVRAFTYLNSSVLMARGKPSWRVLITAVTAALSLAGFLVAVQFGIVAVAAAAVAVGYAVAPISYAAVRRLVPIEARPYLRELVGPLLAALAMAAAMLVARRALGDTAPIVTLLVATTVGVVVYVAGIHVFARALAEEARGLARMVLPAPRPAGVVAAHDATLETLVPGSSGRRGGR